MAAADSDADPDALFAAAVLAHTEGRREDARSLYDRVLAVRPEHAGALANIGRLARSSGDDKAALNYYERATAVADAPPEVFFNLGNVRADLGDRVGAAAAYNRALELTLGFAKAREKLARLSGDVETASAAPNYQSGVSAEAAGEIDKAIASYQRALEAEPAHDSAATRLAQLYFHSSQGDEAVALLEAVAARNPHDAAALQNLGFVFRSTGHYAKALEYFERASKIDPDREILRIEIANCLVNLGRPGEGRKLLAGMLETPQGRRAGASSYLMTLLYDPEARPQFIRQEHERLTRDWATNPAKPCRPKRAKLRIGYLTADFYGNHPVAQFIAPVITAHAGGDFGIEAIAYDANPRHDATAKQMATLCEVRSIAGKRDDEAAAIMEKDSLDLLIDLSGHTSGRRLPVLGLRPAPVQACFIGYPSTTGFRAVDYLIADRQLAPEGEEDLYTEKIVRLPNSFLCFSPPTGMPEPRPRHSRDTIVFGSLNHLPKLNAALVKTWAGILEKVENSVLLLQCAAFAERESADRVAAMFEAAGTPRRSLALCGPQPFAEAMRRYDEIDIALDPFPYNGGTTTCHALWMGKPVVSLAGGYFCGRMGASLLTAAGGGQWIAQSGAEYVALAAKLSADIRAGRFSRQAWRQRVLSSPLVDLPGYAADVAKLYRELAHGH